MRTLSSVCLLGFKWENQACIWASLSMVEVQFWLKMRRELPHRKCESVPFSDVTWCFVVLVRNWMRDQMKSGVFFCGWVEGCRLFVEAFGGMRAMLFLALMWGGNASFGSFSSKGSLLDGGVQDKQGSRECNSFRRFAWTFSNGVWVMSIAWYPLYAKSKWLFQVATHLYNQCPGSNQRHAQDRWRSKALLPRVQCHFQSGGTGAESDCQV